MSEPLQLPANSWLTSVALREIFDAFAAAGQDVRVVGGATRNTLLGLPVRDIDLATPAHPGAVELLCKAAGLKVHLTGVSHGTVTVVASGTAMQVTTLRRDVETDGRHAVVAFTTDWAEDAARRDFRINAIYASADGTLFDPVGGLPDIRRRAVRFIGDPEHRIREDYLRILRFFRLTAEYGVGKIDREGLGAATRLKDGLGRLSPERIAAEMTKLVIAPRAGEILAVMDQSGILADVVTGKADIRRFQRLLAIEDALKVAPDLITRLTCLTASSEDDARNLGRRLRLPACDVTAMAATCAAAANMDDALDPRAAIYRFGLDTWRRGQLIMLSGRRPGNKFDAGMAMLQKWRDWLPPVLPVRGADVLMQGIQPGPQVNDVLRLFEARWIAAGFPDRADWVRAELLAAVEQTRQMPSA